jgi:hypothetical protein
MLLKRDNNLSIAVSRERKNRNAGTVVVQKSALPPAFASVLRSQRLVPDDVC